MKPSEALGADAPVKGGTDPQHELNVGLWHHGNQMGRMGYTLYDGDGQMVGFLRPERADEIVAVLNGTAIDLSNQKFADPALDDDIYFLEQPFAVTSEESIKNKAHVHNMDGVCIKRRIGPRCADPKFQS